MTSRHFLAAQEMAATQRLLAPFSLVRAPVPPSSGRRPLLVRSHPVLDGRRRPAT